MADESEHLSVKRRLVGGFVTLVVSTGDRAETFSVHEHLIKARSAFFRAAFDEKWREGKSRIIGLREDEPEVINLFLEWLYDEYAIMRFATKAPSPDKPEAQSFYPVMAKLYVLEEKIQLNDLCSSAITAILTFSERKNEPRGARGLVKEVVETICAGTPSDSPARKLLVYLHYVFGNSDWLEEGHVHPESMRDLVEEFLRIATSLP